jgi:hypothetical protein
MSTARGTGLKIWWPHQISPQYKGCFGGVKRNCDEFGARYVVVLATFGDWTPAFLNIIISPGLSTAFR